MADLTVIILTYNEEIHIERCIQVLKKISLRIIIVDSFSTDRTVEIARGLGAEVHQNAFINQAQQFKWALDNCPVSTEWVMRMDADEVFGDDLASEINATLPTLPPAITGLRIRRRQYFLGEWVRFGGRYPLLLLRIWRRGKAHIEQRWMDEHILLDEGEAITLKHDFADHSLRDLVWWSEKHVRYANREAAEVLMGRYGLIPAARQVHKDGGNAQARLRRLAKDWVYNRLPFLIGPFCYFLYRFILLGGFLDGKGGRAYHFLQGFWYRALVNVRVEEIDRRLRAHPDRESRLAALEEMTGLKIRDFAGGIKA